jgi:hypothetical protein
MDRRGFLGVPPNLSQFAALHNQRARQRSSPVKTAGFRVGLAWTFGTGGGFETGDVGLAKARCDIASTEERRPYGAGKGFVST